LIDGYARSPQASSTAEQDISRAWVAALVAAFLLFVHTLTRRTMALAIVVLGVGLGGSAQAQGPINRGDRAWDLGDFRAAAEAYLAQVRRQEGGETAWYNLGTAALAIGDTATARRALERTARSLDPDMRYRSLYNLGLLRLRQAAADSGHASAYLEAAFQHYRDALLLRPGSRDAQWNLELAVRNRPPSSGGGTGGQGGGGGTSEEEQPSGLSPSQAEQILNSMAEEERQTLLDRVTRRRRGRETRGWNEW
jgi:tetratricopeptide (TPR) repeat protein